MKVLLVATLRRKAGATYYAKKLAEVLAARLVAADQPIRRLLFEARTSDADVVHIQFEYATFGSVARSLVLLPVLSLLLSQRRPVVVTLHGVVTKESLEGGRFPRLVLLAYHLSYRAANAFVATFVVHSELMRTTLASEYAIRKAVVIPLGFDSAPLTRFPVKGMHIAFFGFVRPSKGVEELIGAMELLRETFPDLRLKVAGGPANDREAAYLDTLLDAAQRTDVADRVDFLTRFLTEEEKAAVVASSRVLVLPYKDTFVEVSAVVHDFAAYGVPVIVSDRPRFSELTDGRDCLKVSPEAPALAAAVSSLLRDPVLAARLSEGLREKAEAGSWDHVGGAHMRLYGELAGH